jgi:hypothetical protein
MLLHHVTMKLIVGTALAMLLTSPTFAQSYNAEYGTGNVINQLLAKQSRASSAYASSGPFARAYRARPGKGLTDAERALFARQGLSAVPSSAPQRR